MLKKIIIHAKRSIQFVILFIISIFLIIGTIAFLYKPTYSVFIGDEQVGYTKNKSQLQKRINNYIENGEDNNKNIAFVQVDTLPNYKLCLLKKNIDTNDEEIFSKISEQGIPYYRYYAILDDGQEKFYVSSFEEAEKIIQTLKEKNSTNIDKISILEKYDQNLAQLASVEEAVSKLFIEPAKVVEIASNGTAKYGTKGTKSPSSRIVSQGKVDLGISLIKPVSGIISSRFASIESVRNSRRHTGIDIAAPAGTTIVAAAAGTVTFSGYSGGYGNMLIITHPNSVQTYYGHCSKLYVSAGATISQGQAIAAVGSTGNSTGPHLHLEVRKNGISYNPQNYVY